nr:unnamed protein product [Callosobruchus analis]
MIWILLLGIESTSKLPKVTRICGRHFGEKDFVYDLAGKRNLKDGADPVDSSSFQYEPRQQKGFVEETDSCLLDSISGVPQDHFSLHYIHFKFEQRSKDVFADYKLETPGT